MIQQEYKGVDIEPELRSHVGDRRRTERLEKVASAMARHPDASFPDMMGDAAAMEGLYRILRNEHLCFDSVFGAHRAQTAARASELDEVLVIHDTTEFSWPRRDGHQRKHLSKFSARRQGFLGHFSIVASADGLRAPLGTIALDGYVHATQADEGTVAFWNKHFSDLSEGERWVEGLAQSEAALAHPQPIHVCDREADRNDVLKWLDKRNARYVIRYYQQARKTVTRQPLSEILDSEKFRAQRKIELSPRSLHKAPNSRHFPPRSRRDAMMSFRSATADVKLCDGTVIPMTLVEAIELDPPDGEEPVQWILMTSEPAETAEELLRVIDIYRSRWLVEEYFKALKTGCAYEKRQLDSAQTLLIALALAIPVAWRLLALRYLSRHAENMPATAILTPLQLTLLRRRTPKLTWSEAPSVAEALAGIASIAGHHRPNGPPGWQLLGRGLRELLTMEVGARLVAEEM